MAKQKPLWQNMLNHPGRVAPFPSCSTRHEVVPHTPLAPHAAGPPQRPSRRAPCGASLPGSSLAATWAAQTGGTGTPWVKEIDQSKESIQARFPGEKGGSAYSNTLLATRGDALVPSSDALVTTHMAEMVMSHHSADVMRAFGTTAMPRQLGSKRKM